MRVTIKTVALYGRKWRNVCMKPDKENCIIKSTHTFRLTRAALKNEVVYDVDEVEGLQPQRSPSKKERETEGKRGDAEIRSQG